jgi:FAD/FMN-containing dehydrogenase
MIPLTRKCHLSIRFLALTIKPTKELTDTIKRVMLKSPHMKTIRSVTAGTGVFSWQPISTNLIEAGRRSGGNALGLEAVDQSWFHIDLIWWNAEDDEAMRIAGESLMEEIESAARKQGSHIRYIFMNDANERQDVMASYGTENVLRMRQVQDYYDPHQVFHRLLVGAFKLPHSQDVGDT